MEYQAEPKIKIYAGLILRLLRSIPELEINGFRLIYGTNAYEFDPADSFEKVLEILTAGFPNNAAAIIKQAKKILNASCSERVLTVGNNSILLCPGVRWDFVHARLTNNNILGSPKVRNITEMLLNEYDITDVRYNVRSAQLEFGKNNILMAINPWSNWQEIKNRLSQSFEKMCEFCHADARIIGCERCDKVLCIDCTLPILKENNGQRLCPFCNFINPCNIPDDF